MICIRNYSTNPYFNLATEEYLLKNIEDDIFMLWRNAPSVIVGKHQNTLAEININYVKKNNIPVVRRLSGGGAVFHDLGNINFTFIMSGEPNKLVDFRKYTQPIIDLLQKLGINATFSGRNDLLIDERKFSGNAEHVYKNRVLHHGTLLFSSVMDKLEKVLEVNPLKFEDKAVKSVRSRVTNISEHLKEKIEITQFIEMIYNHIFTTFPNAKFYELSDNDKKNITDLVINKYETWDWNYGYSPKYNFHRQVQTGGGILQFEMLVDKGFIREIKIYGDFFSLQDISILENALTNIQHDEAKIIEALFPYKISNYFLNITKEEFLRGLF